MTKSRNRSHSTTDTRKKAAQTARARSKSLPAPKTTPLASPPATRTEQRQRAGAVRSTSPVSRTAQRRDAQQGTSQPTQGLAPTTTAANTSTNATTTTTSAVSPGVARPEAQKQQEIQTLLGQIMANDALKIKSWNHEGKTIKMSPESIARLGPEAQKQLLADLVALRDARQAGDVGGNSSDKVPPDLQQEVMDWLNQLDKTLSDGDLDRLLTPADREAAKKRLEETSRGESISKQSLDTLGKAIGEPQQQVTAIPPPPPPPPANTRTPPPPPPPPPATRPITRPLAKVPAQTPVQPPAPVSSTPWIDNMELSPETQRVTTLYQHGELMITAVLPRDLAKVHDKEARRKVADHVKEGKISMEDKDKDGDLKFAKVNWALAGAKIPPYFFNMMNDDLTPKTAGPNSGITPRIATLADPRAMGQSFVKGTSPAKMGWGVDQGSSKGSGIENDVPLLGPNDPAVIDALATIKKDLEGTEKGNSEINTFGFPPDAVVGFLVTEVNDTVKNEIRASVSAMSPDQQKRTFPVFTWEKSGDKDAPWKLKLLAQVGGSQPDEG